MLSVVELVSSIQGEGKYTGYPTTFVRLHNCNLSCNWCDTKYSMKKRRKKMSLNTMINYISRMKNEYVCITGGEPLLQDDCLPLVYELVDKYYKVNIETNGSIEIDSSYKRSFSYTMDIKCPSSGMSKFNKYTNLENLQTVDEVKFVIADEDDYDFAKKVIGRYPTHASFIFSPLFREDIKDTKDFSKLLSQMILEDKLRKVRLGLQIHKILGVY